MDDIKRILQLTADVQKAAEKYNETNMLSDYKDIQSRVRRLQVAASSPEDILFTFRLQVIGNIGVVMLNELGVLDALVAKDTGEATAAELAAATGCGKALVVRLMRLVCSLCFCEEIEEETYRATQTTRLMVLPGWKGAFRWMDLIYPVAGGLRRYLASNDFDKATLSQTQTAFEFVHHKPMWKVLEENPEQRHNFDLWMAERKKHEETLWHRNYPPSSAITPQSLKSGQDAVLMVDVGGATGTQLLDFKKQFPELPGRFVLQDLPESIEAVVPPAGMEKMGYDLFDPQPIKGARFYYLRSILHNWPDDKCIKILHNTAEAMDPEYSTLLIDDYVLPTKGAELRSALADIHMLSMFNSSERTLAQYSDLLKAVGLHVMAVYPAGVNEESIIEVKLCPNLNGYH